jgi:uncharacterized membrane protein
MAENKADDSPESAEAEIADDEGQSSSSDRVTAELTLKRRFEFSGPLPPPQVLKGYNEAFAGCAERILAMAERQSAHRQDLEKRIVTNNCAAQTRGQWFAFILAFVVLTGGVYLLSTGKSLEGFAAIIIALGSLIGSLIYGRSEQRKEREEKGRNLPEAPPQPFSSNPSDLST